jgi:hypothetical protein
MQLLYEIYYEMVYTVGATEFTMNFAVKSATNWLIQSTLQDSLPIPVLMGFERINGHQMASGA